MVLILLKKLYNIFGQSRHPIAVRAAILSSKSSILVVVVADAAICWVRLKQNPQLYTGIVEYDIGSESEYLRNGIYTL